MSEHSKGHCDQRGDPATATSPGDSHEVELHRSPIDRSVPPAARNDAVQTEDYELHEAMDTDGGGVALPIRQRGSHSETRSTHVPAIRQFDIPVRPYVAEPEVGTGEQHVTTLERQLTGDVLGNAESEDENKFADDEAEMPSEQRDDVALADDLGNYDLGGTPDNGTIEQSEVEAEDEETAMDADGPMDPAYPFFLPRNPAWRWADDVDTSEHDEASHATSSGIAQTATANAQLSIDLFLQSRATDSRPQADTSKTSTIDEEMVDREQTPPATNVPPPDSPRFLEWKAKGRPVCPTCLGLHYKGECELQPWEWNLLNTDPEGYARYRKRKKKSRARRGQQRAGGQQSPPPQQPLPPLQNVQPSVGQSGPQLGMSSNNPWLLRRCAGMIRNCPTSELEDLQRQLAAESNGVTLAQIATETLQQRRAAGIDSTEPQPSDNRQDTIPDETRSSDPRAPDPTTTADTPSTNGPSVDFRSGSERAYHRALERGGPSAKSEGKQPKK